MLQPKKCAICNTINDGSRHFCIKCGAFLSSAPIQQKKVQSVWEEEGGGGIINDPFGTGVQDSYMSSNAVTDPGLHTGPAPYGNGQPGSSMQPGSTYGSAQADTQSGNIQPGSAAAGGYIVRCPQCGKIHPVTDKKLPNVCSQCFYFFQPGVDKVVPAASMASGQNAQNPQNPQNSQNLQNPQNPQSPQNSQFSRNGQSMQQGMSGVNTGGFGNSSLNQGQIRGLGQTQGQIGQGQISRGQMSGGQMSQNQMSQSQAGNRQTGQGPLAGRSALASSRPDDSRLMLLAISNKKMPPAEIAPQGDIIGDGGTIFPNLKTGIKLSLWHTPAGWYARAMQGNVLYNGLPMNVGFQKKLSDGDMFSFDAGQFRVEIIG